MYFKQRDLVSLNVKSPLPNGDPEFHPFLIINTIDVPSYEKSYIGVMLTSSDYINRFSFNCPDTSFEAPLKPNSHIQMHIVQMIRHDQIKGFVNRMKKEDFEIFLEEFNSLILKID